MPDMSEEQKQKLAKSFANGKKKKKDDDDSGEALGARLQAQIRDYYTQYNKAVEKKWPYGGPIPK
jgi:hypothetical protein